MENDTRKNTNKSCSGEHNINVDFPKNKFKLSWTHLFHSWCSWGVQIMPFDAYFMHTKIRILDSFPHLVTEVKTIYGWD